MTRRHPVNKIMHDWNRGMKTTEIRDKYGFKNTNQVHSTIRGWRRVGHDFHSRCRNRCLTDERADLTAIRRKAKNAGVHIGADLWQA